MVAARSLELTRTLNPALQTFEQFVAKNKEKIQAATQPAPAV